VTIARFLATNDRRLGLEMSHLKPNVVVYTREGCHLCDDAKQLLGTFGIIPTEIDIDEQSALLAQYRDCVPVVKIDGKVRFRGKIDPVLLRRILRRR
jgi:glutaredoxin